MSEETIDSESDSTRGIPAVEEAAPKKRARRTSKKKVADEASPADAAPEAPAEMSGAELAEKPKRRPGRPRKAKTDAAAQESQTNQEPPVEAVPPAEKPKKRPGRPRKVKAVDAEAAPVVPAEKPALDSGSASDSEGMAVASGQATDAAPLPEKPKRRPGRPKKAKPQEDSKQPVESPEAPAQGIDEPAKPSIEELNRTVQEATQASSVPSEPPAVRIAPSPEAAADAGAVPGDAGAADSEGATRRRRGRKAKAQQQTSAEGDEQQGASPDQGTTSEQPASDGRSAQPAQTEQPAQDAHPGQGQARKKDRGHNDRGNDRSGNDRGGNDPQNGGRNSRKNRKNRKNDFNTEPSLTLEDANAMKVADLRSKAAELNVDYVGLRKAELVEAVYRAAARAEGFRSVDGILEVGNEGFGWLRTGNYMAGDDDCFVHQTMIRNLGLRPGDRVAGTVGPGRGNAKYPPLVKVATVNGGPAENLKSRPRFRDLTPVFPNEPLIMEHGKDSITGRAIDLVSPIGKGQRGLIVSPPKAGKTTVLKKICQSIAANNPEVHLFCLLVDERPEEVTDMERSIKGVVVASTFDMPADNHTHVSELVIEHAKRLVEMGEDVVVVLDSITRLARAYNLAQPASGRILSGGVDSAALYPPKKFLGAARNIENGGSLTILASALVDTGSKMDEVIFEEFKGTGNMELKLDRDLADRRIFPAIDPVSSGTRNEELLLSAEYQPFIWGIRRVLANMNNTERAANALVKGLKGTKDNREFLIKSAKKAQQADYTA